MDLHVEYPYDAPPEAVWAMFTDRDYLMKKLEATDALEFDVVELAPTPDGGYRIVTARTVEAEIPGFARKIFKPTQAMTQTEDWEADAGGTRPGEWRVDAKGVPVKTGGTTRLEATDAGCVHHIIGSIKVSVPLIGGRLERFVYDQARATMDKEHAFGQRWLAERS